MSIEQDVHEIQRLAQGFHHLEDQIRETPSLTARLAQARQQLERERAALQSELSALEAALQEAVEMEGELYRYGNQCLAANKAVASWLVLANPNDLFMTLEERALVSALIVMQPLALSIKNADTEDFLFRAPAGAAVFFTLAAAAAYEALRRGVNGLAVWDHVVRLAQTDGLEARLRLPAPATLPGDKCPPIASDRLGFDRTRLHDALHCAEVVSQECDRARRSIQ